MKKLTRRSTPLLLMLFLLCSTYVYAAVDAFLTVSSNEVMTSVIAIDVSTCRGLKDRSITEIMYISNASKYILGFKVDTYHGLSQDDKKTYMSGMLEGIANHGSLTAKDKNKLYNWLEERDGALVTTLSYLKEETATDIGKAGFLLKPFTGVVGTILGVITLLVFAFTSVTIVIDVFYIAVPAVSILLGPKGDRTRPILASLDAENALKRAEDGQKDAMAFYMGRKIPQFLIMAICILYLLSGTFYTVISNLISSWS